MPVSKVENTDTFTSGLKHQELAMPRSSKLKQRRLDVSGRVIVSGGQLEPKIQKSSRSLLEEKRGEFPQGGAAPLTAVPSAGPRTNGRQAPRSRRAPEPVESSSIEPNFPTMQLVPRSGIDRRSSPAHNDPVLIRLPAVIAICAMSRSCIYEAIKNGTFPAPVKLNGRPSAWIKQEVIQWVNDRIHASRQA